jgi:plasmid maintenance system antidote protein VapI
VRIYKTGNQTQYELAARFGVSRSAIIGILNGKNWAHITHIDPKQPRHNRLITLTEKQVLEMVEVNQTGNHTHKQLAEQFGTTTPTVSAILTGRNWSETTGIIYNPKPKKLRP